MNYEGINFNDNWVASKTEKEFLAEADINQWFDGDKNRKFKLKEVYSLCNKVTEKSTTVAAEK